MTLSVADVACLNRLRDRLPELEPHDRDHVLAHGVALYTAGIAGDAAKERSVLENLILLYGWHVAYRRYVENCLRQFGEPVTFEEWRYTYGK